MSTGPPVSMHAASAITSSGYIRRIRRFICAAGILALVGCSHSQQIESIRLTTSRVGFDRTFTHAMVQYGVGVGTGPMPQCGWASSSTTLLEKRNGVWVIDRAVDGWVT